MAQSTKNLVTSLYWQCQVASIDPEFGKILQDFGRPSTLKKKGMKKEPLLVMSQNRRQVEII